MKNKEYIRKIIREELSILDNSSIFISESYEYGSFEGVIHINIENVKNWFIKRKINPENYIKELELPIAFLNNINIYEDYRGKGYGNSLYSEFEGLCYDNDAKYIILESDNDEYQNKGFNLEKWYESFDFDTIGVEGGNSIMIKHL